MTRGPHDEEIENNQPERDKARERRDEFLRQRGIPAEKPDEGESEEERSPDQPKQ
jgi:hypothetical protein